MTVTLTLTFERKYAPKCHGCGHLITPAEGSNETVRVVSMEKDFHFDCYVCAECGVQLTDENEKRCYPLDNCLLCLACHLGRLGSNSSSASCNQKSSSHSNGYADNASLSLSNSESKSPFTYPSGAPPPPPPPPSYYQSSHQQKQSVNGYY